MKKSLVAAAVAAIAFTPMVASAQGSAPAAAPATAAPSVAPTVGAKVFDPQGAEVGSIEKVDAANAVVYTGTKRATLPLSAFAKNDKGLLISMSQSQLNAAVAAAETQTTAAMDTKLVADAPIKSKDGAVVGKVQKVEGDNVTITMTDGNPVTLTKQYLALGADGGLALTMNSTEFKSAVAAATQSAPAAAASTGTATADTPDAAGQ